MTRTRSRRRFALAVPLAASAAAVLLAGCSSTMQDAATITIPGDDGDEVVHIRRDDFEDDLATMAANETFLEQLRAGGFDVADGADGTVDAQLSALWLNNLIYQVAIDAEFEARGLEVGEEERERAAQELTIFDSFDEDFKAREVERQARRNAVLDDIAGELDPVAAPTEEEMRAYYAQNEAALTACPSGREVSHILVEQQADAEAIRAELAAGASFDELATSRSQDPGSAAAGGSLGCLGASPFVEPFQSAADGAPVGEVVGPVQTEFGFHLILVEPWAPTFEKFRAQIEQQLTAESEQRAQQERNELVAQVLNDRIASMDVQVDARYGRWEFDEASQTWALNPPEAPEPPTGREERTTTTAPSVAPGAGDQPDQPEG